MLVLGTVSCTPAAPASPPDSAASPWGSSPASGSGAVASNPQASNEWDRIVAAGKQQGKVVIIGVNTADAREALTEGFQRRYPEIQVEYNAAGSSDFAPKVIAERQADKYLPDVIVHGTNGTDLLKRAGALDPLPRYLVGPESRDESRWLGGRFEFADTAGEYIMVLANIVSPAMTYNPELVVPSEIKSYKDFLAPKWRGRIAMFDPRVSGTGQGMATFFYTEDTLGKDFMRQLFAQNLAFSRDDRQIVDWVVRGQYSAQLGASQQIAADLRAKGISIEMLSASEVVEGGYLSAGPSGLSVLNRAPHPNAAKVYVDWLLSRGGQTAFVQAIGYVSRRLDAPSDHVPDYLVPRQEKRYHASYKEEIRDLREEINDFLRATIGS
jgi:iron(III) transport system substrate-binding protein